MEPFAFRTPVAIPELGAESGDWIECHPDDPCSVYVIHEVPRAIAAAVFDRIAMLTASLPPPSCASRDDSPPQIRRLK